MSTAPVDSPEPTPPVAALPVRPRRQRRTLVIAAVGVLALTLGVIRFLTGRGTVTTDDAQIEGHIVPIVARVGGYVASVRVEENQSVRAGDLLVQIDDRELRARLAEAEARLASASAMAGSGGTAGQARAQVAAARANVAEAEATANKDRADLERFRALARQDVISRQQLDQAVATAAISRAKLVAAREQVVASNAGLRAAGSQVAAARATRDEAALQLSYARITAPLDGVVSRKAVELGQLVQAGQPVMNIVPLSDVWVVANLKETQLRGVDVGDPADIRVDGDPKTPYHATVESLSPATGAKFSLLPPDNASGNFTKVVQRVPVRLRLDRAHNPRRPLRPGMSVKVTIHAR